MNHFLCKIIFLFGLYVTSFASEHPRPIGTPKRLRGKTQRERQLSNLAEQSSSTQPSITPSESPSMAPTMALSELKSMAYQETPTQNQTSETKKELTGVNRLLVQIWDILRVFWWLIIPFFLTACGCKLVLRKIEYYEDD